MTFMYVQYRCGYQPIFQSATWSRVERRRRRWVQWGQSHVTQCQQVRLGCPRWTSPTTRLWQPSPVHIDERHTNTISTSPVLTIYYINSLLLTYLLTYLLTEYRTSESSTTHDQLSSAFTARCHYSDMLRHAPMQCVCVWGGFWSVGAIMAGLYSWIQQELTRMTAAIESTLNRVTLITGR